MTSTRVNCLRCLEALPPGVSEGSWCHACGEFARALRVPVSRLSVRSIDPGAVEAARVLLPVHSDEQLARIGEFGCSSLPSHDRPCGCCVDCTPEDDLIPPRFAVADLPGFDSAAARRLAEIELTLDEATREPAPKSAPRPWLLPIAVLLYPVALLVALTTEVVPVVRRLPLRRVGRVLLLLVAAVAAVMVLGVAGCVAWSALSWVWSYLGWWTVPVGIVVLCASGR